MAGESPMKLTELLQAVTPHPPLPPDGCVCVHVVVEMALGVYICNSYISFAMDDLFFGPAQCLALQWMTCSLALPSA